MDEQKPSLREITNDEIIGYSVLFFPFFLVTCILCFMYFRRRKIEPIASRLPNYTLLAYYSVLIFIAAVYIVPIFEPTKCVPANHIIVNVFLISATFAFWARMLALIFKFEEQRLRLAVLMSDELALDKNWFQRNIRLQQHLYIVFAIFVIINAVVYGAKYACTINGYWFIYGEGLMVVFAITCMSFKTREINECFFIKRELFYTAIVTAVYGVGNGSYEYFINSQYAARIFHQIWGFLFITIFTGILIVWPLYYSYFPKYVVAYSRLNKKKRKSKRNGGARENHETNKKGLYSSNQSNEHHSLHTPDNLNHTQHKTSSSSDASSSPTSVSSQHFSFNNTPHEGNAIIPDSTCSAGGSGGGSIESDVTSVSRATGNTRTASSPFSTLDQVLRNDEARKLFSEHLVREFSIENLMFVCEVNRFRQWKSTDIDSVYKVSCCIYVRYIRKGSPFEVNLSGKLFQPLSDAFEPCIYVSRHDRGMSLAVVDREKRRSVMGTTMLSHHVFGEPYFPMKLKTNHKKPAATGNFGKQEKAKGENTVENGTKVNKDILLLSSNKPTNGIDYKQSNLFDTTSTYGILREKKLNLSFDLEAGSESQYGNISTEDDGFQIVKPPKYSIDVYFGIFTPAFDDIFKMLSSDSFLRFQQSSLYKKLIDSCYYSPKSSV